MASHDPACMPCSRRSIDAALADPRVTSHALRMRFIAVDKLLAQTQRFYPWPALEEALRADLQRLAVALREKEKRK